MLISKAPVYIDGSLLQRAEIKAVRIGREPTEVIEEALRRYLEFDALLERVWSTSPDDLTEDESLNLAYQELRAMRAEKP